MLLMVLIPSINFAESLTHKQYKIVVYGAEEGKKINVQSKYDIPAIIHQETKSGKLGRWGDGGDSLGVGQMQKEARRIAARMLYGKDHGMSDQMLAYKIKTDDRFAVKMTAAYYKYLLDMFHGNRDMAILAYNVGPYRVKEYGLSFDPNNYLRKVKRYAKMFESKV
jgi:hypothetical protein